MTEQADEPSADCGEPEPTGNTRIGRQGRKATGQQPSLADWGCGPWGDETEGDGEESGIGIGNFGKRKTRSRGDEWVLTADHWSAESGTLGMTCVVRCGAVRCASWVLEFGYSRTVPELSRLTSVGV